MRDGYRTTSKNQTRRPRATTEIHIVEMEIELLIKSHSCGAQRVTLGGKQYTVEQFAFRWRGAIIINRPEGRLGMGHGTAVVFPILAPNTPRPW